MIYSHQLTYTLLADSIEELSLTFYGTNLELQDLELVLSSEMQPTTEYSTRMKEFIQGITAGYEGKLEYIIELSYNEKLKAKEIGLTKENHCEL